jgi:hypothetical protein
MGMFGGISGRPARAYYPSGPMLGPQPVAVPQPDPANYRWVKHREIGPYTIVMLQYPGCRNYEGRKIIVYKERAAVLKRQDELDPHFLETGLSPIARFRPTDDGWDDARRFVEASIQDDS